MNVRSEDRRDIVTGALLALFAIVLFASTFLLPDVRDTDPLGMAFFPRVLLLAMFGLSISVVVGPLMRPTPAAGKRAEQGDVDERDSNHQVGTVAISVAATLLYGLCIPVVGYFWITPLYLGLLLWVGGLRRIRTIALVVIGFTAFAYIILYRVLDIPLTSM